MRQAQGGGLRQTEERHGLPIDLHLQRGEPRTAKDHDDAEASETKQKRKKRRRDHRRAQEGQRDFPKSALPAAPQHPRRLHQIRIEVGPKAADDADDNGRVIEDVNQQDDPDGLVQANRRAVQAKPCHELTVQPAPRAQQRRKRGGDHHRGHDEGNSSERQQQALAREFVTSDHVGRRHSDDQRQQRRECGFPEREPERLAEVRLAPQ